MRGEADSETFNIVLMPTLMLKNCLPRPLNIQFVDTNKSLCKMSLQKEEKRNIFQFDLQQEIKLSVSVDGFSAAILTLDTTAEVLEEKRGRLKLQDLQGSGLDIHYTKNSKQAGFALTFFVTNCIVN